MCRGGWLLRNAGGSSGAEDGSVTRTPPTVQDPLHVGTNAAQGPHRGHLRPSRRQSARPGPIRFTAKRSRAATSAGLVPVNNRMDRIVLGFQGNLTHDELLQVMPVSDLRFVVLDLHFDAPDGARRNTLAMICWCPESVDTTQQAACALGYSALRDALDGIEVLVEAADPSDLEYQKLVSQAS
ncbi:cofilin family protein [Streptomyces sp. NPDC020858]|uniref:cofilin family protein n=1 Tax=Streptomyces sp. NPDC020858 TaxID=3365097 RepID=UPI0037B58061